MLDVAQVRSHFPALARTHQARPLVYFDGPGGTQVPRACSDAITDYLARCNANHGGVFVTGVESDAILADAHVAMADFLNAERPEEIVFGPNMTTLTFALSRSLGATLGRGDEIVLTRLDHDANFSPWLLMAQERGVKVRVVDINEGDCTLVLDDFERFLGKRTKLVAVGYASNAVGTINPVKQIVAMARAVGAMTFIDAVHFAPHGPIDVQELGCDFLVCSPYKFFGPHLGALYGRYDRLDALPAYKVRPADPHLPGRLEVGTLNHEGLAGLLGTMSYLEWLGTTFPAEAGGRWRSARAETLHRALASARAWEHDLMSAMLDGLASLRGVRIYGIAERARLHERVPTFAIRVADQHPRVTAQHLAERGICVWDGNYYALNLTERLGVESTGGMVRIGLVHYNTLQESDRLLSALSALADGARSV
jgi:cysteine desulfurase family protein (TIGR01976 family)